MRAFDPLSKRSLYVRGVAVWTAFGVRLDSTMSPSQPIIDSCALGR